MTSIMNMLAPRLESHADEIAQRVADEHTVSATKFHQMKKRRNRVRRRSLPGHSRGDSYRRV